jgi:hypothetical protein
MARHKNPQYNRKRLVVAGIAAVATLGAAVGIGIYGSALADRGNPDAVASEECLPAPTNGAPPAEQPPEDNAPPEENAPPEDNNEGDNNQGDQNQGDNNEGDNNGGNGDNNAPGTPIPDEEVPGNQNGDQNQDQGDQNGDQGQNGGDNGGNGGYGWAANAPLSLNGERPKDSQPGGNNGGDNGGNDGGSDYGGPKPPEQAPEPPPGAPVDDFPGGEECEDELGPFPDDFIDINNVEPNNLADSPETQRGGSNGTFVSDCGTNEEGHFNSANFIVAPGNENGAEHTHDYVGNLDSDGFSDNESLAAAGTTCENQEDQSAYFWPVVRVRNEGSDAVDPLNAHNVGDIQRPVSAKLEFRGNAVDQVEAMPQFIRVLTGDAKSSTNGGANANAKWTCTGFEDRITTKYPICPEGSQTVRIADFPGCWDGQNTDSANHRTHVAFADENGECQDGFVAIPQLRITLTYDLPQGEIFALDAFPAEQHNPITDHNDFVNVMSEDLMDQVVDCINTGQQC